MVDIRQVNDSEAIKRRRQVPQGNCVTGYFNLTIREESWSLKIGREKRKTKRTCGLEERPSAYCVKSLQNPYPPKIRIRKPRRSLAFFGTIT